MNRTDIENKYFEWMFDLVRGKRYPDDISYKELLWYLNDIEFEYYIRGDYNRAADGIDLRRRFAYDYLAIDHAEDYILGPCSILEMMVALAIRIEEIMDNPDYGDRTSQWFWRMIISLGLGGMSDENFDIYAADSIIGRFLDREYDFDGRGGLFTVGHSNRDMRDIEIWKQMLMFINTIT